MRITTAGFSDPGRVREKNDDHYALGPFVEQGVLTSLALDTESVSFRQYGLLVAVADGMGGYAGGAVASRIVLETLTALFYSERREGVDAAGLANSLRRHLEQTLGALEQALRHDTALQDAGTTLAGVALAAPDVLVVFHAGDSRVLRVSGGYLRALTVDHTPVGPDIATGRITEEQAAALPAASRLTRSLGLLGDTRTDLFSDSTWSEGDTFLLGTDGCHGLGRGLPATNIRDMARQTPDAAELAVRLVTEAVRCDGSDNATAVAIRLGQEDTTDVG